MPAFSNLYIIAGCNGAGKTTSAFNILPRVLDCREFVNADEIARGISPFQPETVNVEAGRIMLNRIEELLARGHPFAFETTLSSKNYARTVRRAQQRGYRVTLLFFWLNSVELAKQRVRLRVSRGGHGIPDEVIERRYHRGLKNFFDIYLPICDEVVLVDNSGDAPVKILEKHKGKGVEIIDSKLFNLINHANS